MPDVEWIRVVGDRGGPGTTLLVRTKVFGVPAVTDRVAVEVWEPPSRLVIRHHGLVRGSGEWRLDPFRGGTRFSWSEELRMWPPLLGELGLQLYRPWQAWTLKRSLRNLRAVVESR